jgi:hypothetical protein
LKQVSYHEEEIGLLQPRGVAWLQVGVQWPNTNEVSSPNTGPSLEEENNNMIN